LAALVAAFLICRYGSKTTVNWAVALGSALFVAAGVIFTAATKLHSEERDRATVFSLKIRTAKPYLLPFILSVAFGR
jgi:hypothetical protein